MTCHFKAEVSNAVMLNSRANVHADGESPLIKAASVGNKEITKLLLHAGASVSKARNCASKRERTALLNVKSVLKK